MIFSALPALTVWFLLLTSCLLVSGARASAVSTRPQALPPKAAWMDGLKNGMASAMAAACVKTTLQPIDAVKTLQQYQISKGTPLSVVEACRAIMARPGGFSNFYSGLGVTLIG